MIKRIKKVMALVLVATSVVAIAPKNIFNGNITAYAETNITSKGPTMPTNEQIIAKLESDLKKEYSDCVVVKVIPEPVKTLSITLTTNVATKIATPMAKETAEKMVQSLGLKPGDEGYDKAVEATTKKVLEQLVPTLQAACKQIPIYQYGAIGSDGKTIVGKGFVVGGGIEALLIQAQKNPIYVDATNLDSSVVKELIDKIQIIIKGFEEKITGAIDDIADSVDHVSNSISDLFDDLDDSTDDFFDKIDKDEGWDKQDGYIYYYDEDGIKLRGVNEIDGKNYYFNRIDGAMEKGWQVVDGKRCYFSPKHGYQVYSQWIKDGDKIYCLDEKGEVKKSEWAQDGANTCYLKADGTLAKGWFKVNRDDWYYFDETNGHVVSSTWKWSDGDWYYLTNTGVAATDWQAVDGKWYCFKSSGVMHTGWFRHDGNWYYADYNGSMKTGWVSSKDGWCYLDEQSGIMKKNEWVSVNGKWYYFNLNGIMVTKDRYISGTKYCFNSDGSLQ